MTRFLGFCFLFATILLNTACDNDTATSDTSEQLHITGELSYRERMALPPGSQAKITLEATSQPDNVSGVITKKVIALSGKQIPLPFELNAFRDQLKVGSQYMLTAELAGPDGTLLWSLNQPVIINLHSEHHELGTLLLTRTPVAADTAPIQASFQCGEQVISLRFTDGFAELEIGADRYVLEQVRAASGAKFKSTDGQVMFWNKGNKAQLEINDTPLPECVSVSQANLLPFNAQGNDPGWSVSATETQLELHWNDGQKQAIFNLPDIIQVGNQLEIEAAAAGMDLHLTAHEQRCHDQHGTAYPLTVAVELNGEQLTGCGGDSQQWLTGKEWIVEDLDNKGVIDYSHMSLRFGNDMRVSGNTSCNQYSASYAMSDGLKISQPIATRKACAPALMQQEQRFLATLSQITNAKIDDTGALILSGDGGKKITARH